MEMEMGLRIPLTSRSPRGRGRDAACNCSWNYAQYQMWLEVVQSTYAWKNSWNFLGGGKSLVSHDKLAKLRGWLRNGK